MQRGRVTARRPGRSGPCGQLGDPTDGAREHPGAVAFAVLVNAAVRDQMTGSLTSAAEDRLRTLSLTRAGRRGIRFRRSRDADVRLSVVASAAWIAVGAWC